LRQLVAASTPTVRDKDVQRKRDERSEAARIVIPPIRNLARREASLKDPELFLKTYFADRYRLPFGRHHYEMIDSIIKRAKHGGRQAIAAPRGCGKSELTKGLLCFLLLAGMVRFPLVVAATTDLAQKTYSDFRRKIAYNDLLLDDFPEVCFPVRALEGAPQRASKQHVDGKLTGIVWTANDYISLAHVPGSIYGGVKMTYFGLDSAFRGCNIDGDRPGFVLIDDPETEESAGSDVQIEARENILNKDIAGLASQEENIAIVVLTTVQNRKCYSFKLTDRKLSPSFGGMRFGIIVSWPKDMDLWQEYIAVRHADQEKGDENGRNAVAMYLANREAMDAGVEMLSSHFVPVTLDDGTELVFSAIQQAFNKIADTSMDDYLTEYQNDPPKEEEEETLRLTAGRVASRISGYDQGVAPPQSEWFTVGLDIGKQWSHWVKIGWWGNAIGCITDYGILETHGLDDRSTNKSIELALLSSLSVWRDSITEQHPPLLALIDSGAYSDAIYEFCRRAGNPFYASKGWAASRFQNTKDSDTRQSFLEARADWQQNEKLWLYNVNTEYWKNWLQQRFNTETFDESNNFNDGTLSLFNLAGDKKRHLSFSHHIVAEERSELFEPGKGTVRKWIVRNKNNHFLDATALACAAAGCIGIRLVDSVKPLAVPKQKQRTPLLNQFGQPFLATERNR
jgi:hypothetical protein